jgi:hypothetical protein
MVENVAGADADFQMIGGDVGAAKVEKASSRTSPNEAVGMAKNEQCSSRPKATSQKPLSQRGWERSLIGIKERAGRIEIGYDVSEAAICLFMHRFSD